MLAAENAIGDFRQMLTRGIRQGPELAVATKALQQEHRPILVEKLRSLESEIRQLQAYIDEFAGSSVPQVGDVKEQTVRLKIARQNIEVQRLYVLARIEQLDRLVRDVLNPAGAGQKESGQNFLAPFNPLAARVELRGPIGGIPGVGPR